MKDFTHSMYNTELLLRTAFKKVGSLPLARVQQLRVQEAVSVQVGGCGAGLPDQTACACMRWTACGAQVPRQMVAALSMHQAVRPAMWPTHCIMGLQDRTKPNLQNVSEGLLTTRMHCIARQRLTAHAVVQIHAPMCACGPAGDACQARGKDNLRGEATVLG